MGTANTDADEAILDMLQRYEVLTMDDLIVTQPNFCWAQLFLAVERLSRKNLLALRRFGLNYQIRRMDRALPPGQDQRHEQLAASHQ
ncbi:MAG TPA: hypothetical protein VK901_16460 [Nitrospiraceae bacterium]|nr:hypothetical protein [Nitrospiraceae bacterium]